MYQDYIQWLFNGVLWAATIGHFVVLLAGIQVPVHLKWKVELAKLTPFNRKIFYVYYGYIGGIILTWGILSAILHQEMLRGDKAALCLAAVISLFWTIRIIVDFVYFKSSDWPQGPYFKIGHFLLTTLFIFLAIIYGMVALGPWWLQP